jgi:translation elongation factor EF-Tu-like GTPase|nr:Elongation factor Tu domain 2 [uncultured bacterium]
MSFLKRLFGRKDKQRPDLSLDLASRQAGHFRMPVDEILVLFNRTIVLTGQVERGILQTGEAIQIRSDNAQVYTRVVSIESFDKKIDSAQKGDIISITLPQDVPRSVLVEGMVVMNERGS